MTTARRFVCPDVRRALLATLALLALGAGSVPGHASASNGPAESSDADTITTVLYPGWNLVGWLGSTTPTSELFDTISSLHQVTAWDAEAQAYEHALRDRYRGLPTLTAGMGLWLRLRGSSSVEWERAASGESMALRLRTGRNLVSWTGADGTPVTEALGRLGDALTLAWSWDARAQRYRRHTPNVARSGGFTELQNGSAAWLEISRPVGWWQPGAARPRVIFVGDVPQAVQDNVIAEYWDVRAFVATEFAAVGNGKYHYVGSTGADLREVHRAVWGTEMDTRREFCGRSLGAVHLVAARCAEHSISYQYIDGLPLDLSEYPAFGGSPTRGARSPRWLILGARAYVLDRYRTWSDYPDYERQRFADNQNSSARQVAYPLRYFETSRDALGWVNVSRNALAFLAVDWLADLAGDPAVLEYFRLTPDAMVWHEAFEAAFGISADDFYERFAAYRAEAFPPLAHLTDDGREAVIAVLGDVPSETASAIRSAFSDVQHFFPDRFEAEATEFTLYVAPDATAVLEALPGWYDSRSCITEPSWGLTVVALEYCRESPRLAYIYIYRLVRELAYKQPIPDLGSVYGHAPAWFDAGAVAYAEAAYREASGAEAAGTFREIALAAALLHPGALRDVSTPEGLPVAAQWPTKALGYLAVEWLADHAGDPAIFDYYRRLPDASSRDEAFEGAFGLTFEEFYEQFEAYRETLTAP